MTFHVVNAVKIICDLLVSVLFQFQGGLKAAITADVVQGLSMIACSLAIIIFGSIDVGSFGKVIDLSSERGRLQFFK